MRSFSVVLLLMAVIGVHAQTHIRELMTPTHFREAGLNKLSAAELRVLDQWFAGACAGAGARSTLEARGAVRDFTDLLGASIFASDGSFLGKISRDTLDADSISSTMSPHGSTLGSTSIFNTLGRYGSSLSSLSPFNSLASAPPHIVKDGRQVGYLTKNSLKQPAIDPDELLNWLNPDRNGR